MRWTILFWATLASVLAAATGCGGEPVKAPQGEARPAMPFARVPAGDEDPGDNGPDDSTVLEAMPGGYGKVKFSHFTHSSNGEKGYGVPCRDCHHATRAGEDPAEGCVGCHEVPGGDDPAHGGPDDVLILVGDERHVDMIGPVPFNHFTHASARGYRLGCDRCHHTGDKVACTDCHGEVAQTAGKGVVVPKAKRAFHLMCGRCHDAVKEQNPATVAPTACDMCHTTRGPRPMGGHLTLDRALHVMCIRCHEGVKQAKPDAKAPTRICADCHEGGFSGTARETTPSAPANPEPAAAAADAGPADAGVAVLAAEAKKEPPATLTFKLGKAGKKTKEFSHGAHVDYADSCKKCHHEGLDDATCSGCHEPKDAKKIYHKLCIDCHKESGVAAGCKDCHS